MRVLLAIVGLALAALGLGLVAIGILTLLAAVSEPLPRHFVLGPIGLAAGVATLLWSARLFFGRPRRDGGLLSPWLLRLAAVFYAGLPIAALVFGTWRDGKPPLAVLLLQAGLYLIIGWSLWRLARERSSIRPAQEGDEGTIEGDTTACMTSGDRAPTPFPKPSADPAKPSEPS